jgi:predicted glycosyltransferase
MRFLLYSHDGFGLGHTRRHVAIAAALTELAERASILLASGVDNVCRLALPASVEVLKLPGLRKIGGKYFSRRIRLPTSEVHALRSAILESAARTFRPTVTLVDKHPFGVGGEFCAALRTIKERGGAAVLGLRDILDEPAAVLKDWSHQDLPACIADFYDLVLVYGQSSIFDPRVEYGFPERVVERTHFCGYVVNRDESEVSVDGHMIAPNSTDPIRPVVVATTGGGEDGTVVLESFIRASAGARWQAVVIAGPMTPQGQLDDLRQLCAEHQISLHTFVPSLAPYLASADAIVCMGGYNTLSESVSRGVPIVCVPRVTPRSEQLLRAQAFERLGLLRAVHPANLSPEALRGAVEAALATSRDRLSENAHKTLSFDGAYRAAHHLLALANARKAPARTVGEALLTDQYEG